MKYCFSKRGERESTLQTRLLLNFRSRPRSREVPSEIKTNSPRERDVKQKEDSAYDISDISTNVGDEKDFPTISNLKTSKSPDPGPGPQLGPRGRALILTLPLEILREITSYLSIEANICLTLSCKRILNLLGTASWTSPIITGRWSPNNKPSDMQHRAELLPLLARDMKGWKSCNICYVLHPMAQRPRKFKKTPKTRACLMGDGLIDYYPQTKDGSYVLLADHVRMAFSESVGTASDNDTSPAIDALSGRYKISKIKFFGHSKSYTLDFSARRVDQNLILQITHSFSTAPGKKSSVTPSDVLSFPLRICPHLTTSTKQYRYKRGERWDNKRKRYCRWLPNGPLLTYAVMDAFPVHKRRETMETLLPKVLGLGRGQFREPTMTEEVQMNIEQSERDFWRCRSCPTKFKIVYEDGDLIVMVWQDLGKSQEVFINNWNSLVRREEGWFHGGFAQNCEFDCISRPILDFEV